MGTVRVRLYRSKVCQTSNIPPPQNVSYKDQVTGNFDQQDSTFEDWIETNEVEDSIIFDESVSDGEEGEDSALQVNFSAEEKRLLRKPWRTGLIVKLLGKVLGFKALSARI